MSISLNIRKAVYGLLTGHIFDGVAPIPVYDSFAIPDGTQYPYILVTSQDSGERLTKGRRPSDGTIQIEAVTGFLSPEGREMSEEIMSQVDALVNPRNRANFAMDGYVIGDIWTQRSFSLESKNDIYYVFRKIHVYAFIISDENEGYS